MIKINLKIGASWFQSYGYCEYKFYLHKVLGIDLEITKKVNEGTLIHTNKEKEFIKVAEPISWNKFLESEELTITKEVNFDNQIGDVILLGKIDEIAIDKEKILIIDDKPKAFPNESTRLQLYAYCYLFKEKFKEIRKPIFAVLRERDSNRIVWQKEYSKLEEDEFFREFHRMKNILLGLEDPLPTDNSNKCKACQFKYNCKYSLIGN